MSKREAIHALQREMGRSILGQEAVVERLVLTLLCNGNVLVEGLDSPNSMLSASGTAYGERLSTDSNPAAALGLAHAMAEPARLVRKSEAGTSA